jgi:hypothetical protein
MLQKLLKFVKYCNWKIQNLRHDIKKLLQFVKYYNWKLQNLRHDITRIIKICKILQLKNTKFKTRCYMNY